jgi:hypothetical protein
MRKVSKKQRKALRSVWRLGQPRKQMEHSRRINNAMERALCRPNKNS